VKRNGDAESTALCGEKTVMVPGPPSADKEAIYELLIRAATLLDEDKFLDWLELFAENAQYEMLFRNREIGGLDDYLMKLYKHELVQAMTLLPNHVVDAAKRLHIVSNVLIKASEKTAESRCSFTVYRTAEQGKSTLYAVGHSEDSLVKENGRWLFLKRRVVLDTRMLETHTHVPLL
jgi:3-phenylpropionate/cinnamic acid dioxygenase small subunit